MRDIDLTDDTDLAYASPGPAGVLESTIATDPAFLDAKAYVFPSLGGDFGPARQQVLGGQADGGAALLDAAPVITVTPPIVPTPPVVWPGRAANATTPLNLYPWRKVPPEGLDQNNPNPPPAADPPPPPPIPHGITLTGNVLVGNQGSAVFSGPAQRDATIRLTYAIDGGLPQMLDIMVNIGDNGSQIAAKARAAIDAVFGLDASGTGGTVNVVGIGGTLSTFNLSVL